MKPGDKLIHVPSNRYQTTREVTVTRVGRKYAYISTREDGGESRTRFDRETGLEDTTFGSKDRLLTHEAYAEEIRRKNLFFELVTSGLNIDHPKRAGISTGRLQRLLAIMKEEGEE